MITCTTSPYVMAEQPTSVGRLLLARAFAHWCVLHYGLSPEEVAAALEADEPYRSSDVDFAARLLGELFAAGEMRTWARPVGGGRSTELLPTDWELDDFRWRVATSALDPTLPFDREAQPTHWIFVDMDDFNRVVELSCADVMPAPKRAPAKHSTDSPTPDVAGRSDPGTRTGDRHIRLPEVIRRTGMSASTVYRRIEQKRFPKQVPIEGGNIAAWWESEVDDWIANPR